MLWSQSILRALEPFATSMGKMKPPKRGDEEAPMTPRQPRRQPVDDATPLRDRGRAVSGRAAQGERQKPGRRKPVSATSDAPRSEANPPAALANLIGYHLRLAQEASFAAIRQGLGKSDLKAGWYTILTILSENPGITPTELSRLCGRDRSTLAATLKGLTARGLISSRRKSGDQRSYGVWLTGSGAAMLRRLRTIARAHDARLDAIAGKDKPLLIALLKRIVDELGRSGTPRRQRRGASGRQSRPAPEAHAT